MCHLFNWVVQVEKFLRLLVLLSVNGWAKEGLKQVEEQVFKVFMVFIVFTIV